MQDMYSIHSTMAEVAFRRVAEEDLPSVLSIRQDIYRGLDFLPALYKELLKRYEGYAAIVDNKMVGFMLLAAVDNGATLVVRGDRVAKEYDGSDVLVRLQAYAEKQFLPERSIQRKVVVVETQEKCLSLQEENYKLIFKRKISVFRLDMAKIRASSPLFNVSKIDRKQFSDLLLSEQKEAKLFTDGRFIVDWMSYRLMNSNIPFIVDEGCQMFMSQDVNHLPFFSFGSSYKCRNYYRVTVDTFGDVGCSGQLKEHVFKHCSDVDESESYPVYLVLSFPFSGCHEDINNVFKDIGIQERKLDTYGLEKEI